MSVYQKPAHWANPDNKLFPHQVGFTCPPHDFDAAPSDFLRIAPESVGVHGRMLHLPGYRHELSQRRQNLHLLEEFVECMANNGADVCAQVGSNWVHAAGLGVDGIRDYCARLSDTYQTPFHMAGYALVEALRAMNIERIAVNAVYHRPTWWRGAVGFLQQAGFEVLWAGNFVDQGFIETQAQCDAQIWCFDGELAAKSMQYVAEHAPDADAYIACGMCNFRRAGDRLAQRFVSLEVELEALLGKPLITHDNALYWRVFKTLGVAPTTRQGALLSSLQRD